MSGRKTFAAFLIGILLVQAAWIAAMPAFRGPDEFDHVFRAEGVSHGTIRTPSTTTPIDARGAMTPVRRSVIDAATRACLSYPYTRYYDCHAHGDSKGEWAEVGSGAGAYNPTYYLVVGNVGRFFDGAAVDYAIRSVTALLCALMLAWAALMWTGVGRSRWRTLGLMVALTPVMLFSTTIAAPNGVSYAAALLLWVAGLVILNDPRAPGTKAAASAAAVGAVVMLNTHTTGPLWLLLITVTWSLVNPGGMLEVIRSRRYWPMIAAIGLGTAASVAWTLLTGANLPQAAGSGITTSPKLGELIANETTWLFQIIAAFPLRNEMAPVAVYILWLVGFGLLFIQGIRNRGRSLLVVLWMVIALFATQTILTYVGFKTDGYAWQGRYGLPFVVGLALIPGFLEAGKKLATPLYHSALAAMMIAAGVSVWHVGHAERHFVVRPWTDHVTGGPTLAALAAVLGTAAMIWALGAHTDEAPAKHQAPDSTAEPQREPRTEVLR